MKINSFSLIEQLNEKVALSKDKINTIQNDTTQIRCETLMNLMNEHLDDFKEALVRLEQEKGIKKGIELSVPVVGQFKEVAKKDFEEDKELQKTLIEFLQRVQDTLAGVIKKQQDHIISSSLKLEGGFHAAHKIALEIDKYHNHYEKQKLKAETDELFSKDDDIDSMIAEKRGG